MSIKHRGWYSTEEHLNKIIEIRDGTPFYKRILQRYNVPDGFPYAAQLISQLLSPCISVVSINIADNELVFESIENQGKAMPATPINFRTDIKQTIPFSEIAKISLLPWKSPIYGWSKRNWLNISTKTGYSFLLAVSEIPKQFNNKKTYNIKLALEGL